MTTQVTSTSQRVARQLVILLILLIAMMVYVASVGAEEGQPTDAQATTVGKVKTTHQTVTASATSVTASIDLDDVSTQPGVITMEIQYDPSVITVTNCNMVATGTCNTNYASNIIRLNAASANGMSNSTIVDIDFNIIGTRGDVSPLDITVINAFDIYGIAVNLTDVDGSIQIPSVKLGDVNCDDEVNVVDALFILQFDAALRSSSQSCPPLVGGTSPYNNELYTPSCNVNGDPYCNVVDALFILQCDAGVTNEFCPSP